MTERDDRGEREGEASDPGGATEADRQGYADRDYGFSGRDGFQEGNYSGYYGRGTEGERDNPSASGYGGAGYARGGTDIPRPDREPPDAVRRDDRLDERQGGGRRADATGEGDRPTSGSTSAPTNGERYEQA